MIFGWPPATSSGVALDLRVAALNGDTCAIVADRSWNARHAKLAIERLHHVPMWGQQLIHGTAELHDTDCLNTALPDSCMVELTLIRRPVEHAQWLQSLSEGLAFCDLPGEAQNDKTLVVQALVHSVLTLEDLIWSGLSRALLHDRDVIMAAVLIDGCALRHVEGDLRHDREVTLAAIRSDARALQWAAVEHRCNQEVIEATARHGSQVLGAGLHCFVN